MRVTSERYQQLLTIQKTALDLEQQIHALFREKNLPSREAVNQALGKWMLYVVQYRIKIPKIHKRTIKFYLSRLPRSDVTDFVNSFHYVCRS